MVLVLADLVLAVHFAFVAFVVGGLALIWTGAATGWRWTRNRRFRIAHLAAILFVMVEALIGATCPLTVWEDTLRGTAGNRGFMSRWLHRLLYYNFPEWVFTAAYVAFALAVIATYLLLPPKNRRG
jgi:hypothetical protein